MLDKWLILVSRKWASTSSVFEKRIHYLKKVARLCYNGLYLKILRRNDRMSVSFENKETNRGVLTFTISQDQIKPELDRVFNSVEEIS